jgi:hypothetical protein
MAEEQFVQMYVRDFTTLASRAESGVDVEPQVRKRILETRSHAALMDARKSSGHLAAVSDRLRVEARRDPSQAVRTAADPAGAAVRRKAFLLRVADLLEAEAVRG